MMTDGENRRNRRNILYGKEDGKDRKNMKTISQRSNEQTRKDDNVIFEQL